MYTRVEKTIANIPQVVYGCLWQRFTQSPSSGVSPHLLVSHHGIVRRLGGQWKTPYFMGKSMVKMGLTVKKFPTKTIQWWGATSWLPQLSRVVGDHNLSFGDGNHKKQERDYELLSQLQPVCKQKWPCPKLSGTLGQPFWLVCGWCGCQAQHVSYKILTAFANNI